MNRSRTLLAILLVAGLSALAPVASSNNVLPGLASGAARDLSAGRPVALALPGSSYTLRAVPNPIVAPGVRPVVQAAAGERTLDRPSVTTFRGVVEPAGPEVRLVIDRGLVWGIAVDRSAGTGWVLEPRSDGGATAVAFEHVHREAIGGEDGIASEDNAPDQDPGAGTDGPLLLRLAIEADHSLYSARPTDWAEQAVQILNLVEAVYGQIDVRFQVTHLAAWETPDPYTATHACAGATADGSDGKLEQLRTHWNANNQTVPRDTVHLLTRSLSGGFIGCAYIGALADSRAYGVSRLRLSSAALSAAYITDHVNLLAHELGHNFGGLHERSVGAWSLTGVGPTGMVPPYTVMNPIAESGVLRFSNLSGVVHPTNGWELDNASPMRAYAESRLSPS